MIRLMFPLCIFFLHIAAIIRSKIIIILEELFYIIIKFNFANSWIFIDLFDKT